MNIQLFLRHVVEADGSCLFSSVRSRLFAVAMVDTVVHRGHGVTLNIPSVYRKSLEYSYRGNYTAVVVHAFLELVQLKDCHRCLLFPSYISCWRSPASVK